MDCWRKPDTRKRGQAIAAYGSAKVEPGRSKIEQIRGERMKIGMTDGWLMAFRNLLETQETRLITRYKKSVQLQQCNQSLITAKATVFGGIALTVAGCSQLSDPYAVAGNCPVPDHFWTSEPVYQRMERDTGERFARAPSGQYVLVGRNGDYDCVRVLKIAGRK